MLERCPHDERASCLCTSKSKCACPLCSNKAKTISHILLHCPAVTDIWNGPRIKFEVAASEGICIVIDRWLNFSGSDVNVFDIGTNLWWNVWENRCKWVLERNPFSTNAGRPWQQHRWHTRIVFDEMSPRAQATTRLCNFGRCPFWVWSKRTSMSVLAKLKHAHSNRMWLDGRILLVLAMQVKATIPKLTETEAILLGLKLVAMRLGKNWIVVSDAMNLVKYVTNRDSFPPWRIAHIVHECRNFLCANARVSLEYDRRSSNAAAHKTGCRYLNLDHYGNWLYEALPSHLWMSFIFRLETNAIYNKATTNWLKKLSPLYLEREGEHT